MRFFFAAFLVSLLFNISTVSAQKDEYKVACIGFYNLENLFDTLNNPLINDEDFLPTGRLNWNTAKYVSKQHNMATVISQLGKELSPDGAAILGVAEIENAKVLEDLVAQPELAARAYRVVQFDSPDERGIDCGLLYQPKYFTVLGAKPVPVALKDAKTGQIDYTRDILYVAGTLEDEPVHILVGHWPSRRGGESASAWARATAAGVCRRLVDSLTALNPNAKIIVMGDLNDDPVNKSLTEVLRAKGDTKDMEKGDMYNASYTHFMNGNGTLAYRDTWNLFDQMVLSKGLVHKKAGGWQFYKYLVFREPWLLQSEGAFRGYPFRTFVGDLFINGYSDHLPVYSFLLKKK